MDADERRHRRRRTDRIWIRENWYRDLWMLGLTILLLLGINAQRNEGKARRDQTCIVFERLHQADIKRLATTYQYVDNLSAAQRRQALSRAVIRQIPQLEAQIRNSAPPNYCAGDVGIPDSDLIQAPKRPASIDRLLR